MSRIDGFEFGSQLKEDLLAIANNPHLVWEPVSAEWNEGPCVIYKTIWMNEEESLTISKSSAVLDCPAAVVFDILHHEEEEAEWNEFCALATVLEQYDAHHDVCYLKYVHAFPGSSFELCALRKICIIQENKEYLFAFRSADHPKAPKSDIMRLDVHIGGYIIQALPNDPLKCRVTFYVHMPDFKDPFVVGATFFLVSRILPGISKYIQRSQLDMNRQYLTRAIDSAYRDIYSVFLESSETTGWKEVFKENSVALYVKKTPTRHIMCTTGVTSIEASPKLVIETLCSRSFDPLILKFDEVEPIDENNRIMYTSWKSTVGQMDSLVLQSKRACASGVYSLLSRSVIHAKIPNFSNIFRVNLLPTAYFAHPVSEGKQSLFSYCVQLDMLPYANKVKEEELLPLLMTRNLSIINNIKHTLKKMQHHANEQQTQQVVRAAEEAKNKQTKKLEMISKLCTLLVDQYDEKERLRQQLRTLKEPPLATQIRLQFQKKQEKGPGYSLTVEDEDVFPTSPFPADDKLPPLEEALKPPEKKKAFSLFIHSRRTEGGPTGSSPLEFLPNEILLNILGHLDYKSVYRIAQASKKFRFLIGDEGLWKNLYDHTWGAPGDVKLDYDWRNTFKEKTTLGINWSRGRFQTKILEGHQKSIKNVRFDSDVIVSGSNDKLVKVWNIHTGECLRTLTGPNASVISVSLENGLAKVGYKNGSIRNWDVYTGNWLWEKQFSYWSEGFHFIGTSNLISWDSTVDVWDFDTGARKVSFNGHTKKVTCVEITPDGKFAVSGSTDKTVIRYDLEAQKSTHTYRSHTAAVNAVAIDGNFVASGSNDRVIHLWDTRTSNLNPILTVKGHLAPIQCIGIDEYKIVSGGADNTIRAWDKRTGQCIQRLEGHNNIVTCLQFDDKRIISGSKDGAIIIWNFAPPKHS